MPTWTGPTTGASNALRVRLLVLACELAAPIWTHWAATGNRTYFDGILAMDEVPCDLTESTIAAVKRSTMATLHPSKTGRRHFESFTGRCSRTS